MIYKAKLQKLLPWLARATVGWSFKYSPESSWLQPSPPAVSICTSWTISLNFLAWIFYWSVYVQSANRFQLWCHKFSLFHSTNFRSVVAFLEVQFVSFERISPPSSVLYQNELVSRISSCHRSDIAANWSRKQRNRKENSLKIVSISFQEFFQRRINEIWH